MPEILRTMERISRLFGYNRHQTLTIAALPTCGWDEAIVVVQESSACQNMGRKRRVTDRRYETAHRIRDICNFAADSAENAGALAERVEKKNNNKTMTMDKRRSQATALRSCFR